MDVTMENFLIIIVQEMVSVMIFFLLVFQILWKGENKKYFGLDIF